MYSGLLYCWRLRRLRVLIVAVGSCPNARDSDGETVGWNGLEGLAGDGTLPRVLADSRKEPLAGFRGVIAWYPCCGPAANYRKRLAE